MLHINIICIGKLKEQYLKDALNEYSKRLYKYCSLKIIELPDEKVPENLNANIINKIKAINKHICILFNKNLIPSRNNNSAIVRLVAPLLMGCITPSVADGILSSYSIFSFHESYSSFSFFFMFSA